MRRLLALLALVAALPATVVAQGTPSSNPYNFNGTAINPGSDLWFTAVFQISGLGSAGATITFDNSTIAFSSGSTNYDITVPNAVITFSPTAVTATTNFNTSLNEWQITDPLSFAGNAFLDGVAVALPSGLAGGVNPVTWSGSFLTSTPGVTLQWQWGAAAYSTFTTNYNALAIKPLDDNSNKTIYGNSDHAGTPESTSPNYKSYVVGGGSGGGGSNWTGSYSGTRSVSPMTGTVSTPEPSTVALFGTGLLFIIGLRARLRRRLS